MAIHFGRLSLHYKLAIWPGVYYKHNIIISFCIIHEWKTLHISRGAWMKGEQADHITVTYSYLCILQLTNLYFPSSQQKPTYLPRPLSDNNSSLLNRLSQNVKYRNLEEKCLLIFAKKFFVMFYDIMGSSTNHDCISKTT